MYRAFDVYLGKKNIDTVFYSGNVSGVDCEEVRRSLIGHDGYDPGIVVKERRRKADGKPEKEKKAGAA